MSVEYSSSGVWETWALCRWISDKINVLRHRRKHDDPKWGMHIYDSRQGIQKFCGYGPCAKREWIFSMEFWYRLHVVCTWSSVPIGQSDSTLDLPHQENRSQSDPLQSQNAEAQKAGEDTRNGALSKLGTLSGTGDSTRVGSINTPFLPQRALAQKPPKVCSVWHITQRNKVLISSWCAFPIEEISSINTNKWYDVVRYLNTHLISKGRWDKYLSRDPTHQLQFLAHQIYA